MFNSYLTKCNYSANSNPTEIPFPGHNARLIEIAAKEERQIEAGPRLGRCGGARHRQLCGAGPPDCQGKSRDRTRDVVGCGRGAQDGRRDGGRSSGVRHRPLQLSEARKYGKMQTIFPDSIVRFIRSFHHQCTDINFYLSFSKRVAFFERDKVGIQIRK